MSKAFTRESDESGDKEITAVRVQLPPGTRNYITREGAERLEERLKALRIKKQEGTMPECDRRRLEAEIRSVQEVLGSVVVAQKPLDQGRVAFGARVVVRHENGEEEKYRIVGVEESDPEHGSISWVSPLARALLSRKPGDKVRFGVPGGQEELTILSVSY